MFDVIDREKDVLVATIESNNIPNQGDTLYIFEEKYMVVEIKRYYDDADWEYIVVEVVEVV